MNKKLKSEANDTLFDAILSLQTRKECYQFFEDICTVSEIRAISQRLHVAQMLEDGESYDSIVLKTGASTATISRVKRCLVYGADGYKIVLKRLADKER